MTGMEADLEKYKDLQEQYKELQDKFSALQSQLNESKLRGGIDKSAPSWIRACNAGAYQRSG